jgi:hypothetical protein
VKIKFFIVCAALVVCGSLNAYAQQGGAGQVGAEQPVPLSSQAVALDSMGRPALSARLLTTQLQGMPDAPVKNASLVIENKSASFYNYVSGWATFYDGAGVRCGEGLFKLDALAMNESAETDLPGLRLKCAPASWRIVATNLLTRTSDTAKPVEQTSGQSAATSMTVMPPLVISIDGEEHPIQLDNPIVVRLGNRRRTITVRTAP